MYAAITGSKHFNATLVLPQWNIGDPNNVQLVETSHLWDTARLLEHAAEEGISVMFPTVAERSRMCSSKPIGIRLESRLPAFAAGEYDTMCVSGGELFAALWKQDLLEEEVRGQGFLLSERIFLNSGRFAAARKWLQPTRQITERAQHVMRTLLTSRERFYAVHVRTEDDDDFADACAGRGPSPFNAGIGDMKCTLSMQEIAGQLQLQGVESGSFLYVFPWQADKVAPLCQDAYQCIHRGMVDQAHDLHDYGRALLDFEIAMTSDGVFGNIYSTASVELVASMRARNKKAAFLNTTCSKEPSERFA